MTRTTIGRYRNARPSVTATMLKADIPRRTALGLFLDLPELHVLIDHDRHDQETEQRHRNGRGRRPVLVGKEFRPQRLPDHLRLRPAEQVGYHELADDRNEAQE